MAKLKYEDVQNEIEQQGWKLVSATYTNLKTEMDFLCPQGHKVFVTLEKWRRNPFCPICSENAIKVDISNPEKKDKNIIRVLALDDATNITGWSIFDGSKLITYGKFQIDKENPIERMSILKQWMLNMIIKWNPDKVGIEDIQLQKFKNGVGEDSFAVTTYKVLAQLQGVLLETLYSQKKDAIIVHSATWKAFCKITAKNRTDQKRAAQLRVKEWYGVNVTQDEADAICMGKYLGEKYIKNNEMISWG